MAKQKNSKLGNIAKGGMDDYILLTQDNRKHLITIGKQIHVIQGGVKINIFDIRPRLKAGWMTWKGDPFVDEFSVFISEEESPFDYKEGFESILNSGIKKKILYVKKGEGSLTYTHKPNYKK